MQIYSCIKCLPILYNKYVDNIQHDSYCHVYHYRFIKYTGVPFSAVPTLFRLSF